MLFFSPFVQALKVKQVMVYMKHLLPLADNTIPSPSEPKHSVM